MYRMREVSSTLHVKHAATARAARVIAISGAIGLLACSDTTAPTAKVSAPPSATPIPAAMVNVANSLDDMTAWWMPSVHSETDRSNLQQILAGLKGHLNLGNLLLCEQDVAAARGALSRLSDAQQVETAPIGLALDIVQSTLDGSSK